MKATYSKSTWANGHSSMPNKKIRHIMKFYDRLASSEDYEWVRWAETRKRFTKNTANKFFIGVMLDQGQVAERAWNGGNYFVDNYFNETNDFWGEISNTHYATIKRTCQKGFNGKSFAIKHSYNRFPKDLKSTAIKIITDYDSDARNIWNVNSKNVSLIYERFIEFNGIGYALAKMAQFILTRNYGIAGGRINQHKMAIKPDILVKRVLSRVGITSSENTNEVIKAVQDLALNSPADFDAAAWTIGREYCFNQNPNCQSCPIHSICNFRLAP